MGMSSSWSELGFLRVSTTSSSSLEEAPPPPSCSGLERGFAAGTCASGSPPTSQEWSLFMSIGTIYAIDLYSLKQAT